jgi:hypothetical protein
VPAPSGNVVADLLADARQTKQDIIVMQGWFNSMAAGEKLYCTDIAGHVIHTPRSDADAEDPQLAPLWGEYWAAIGSAREATDWVDSFCRQGAGWIETSEFYKRRGLASEAQSHIEHVVQGLEALE